MSQQPNSQGANYMTALFIEGLVIFVGFILNAFGSERLAASGKWAMIVVGFIAALTILVWIIDSCVARKASSSHR